MIKQTYVCQECGSVSPKWKGKCDGCGKWDTFVIEKVNAHTPPSDKVVFESLDTQDDDDFPRLASGMKEFDRVCGGGIVPGSVSLVAGDPGIGKSTLLLQLAAHLSKQTSVIYVSGEESASQIRMRAKRLGLETARVNLLSTNQLDSVFPLIPKVLSAGALRGFMIVDSIQTMMIKEMGATAGTLGQIR